VKLSAEALAVAGGEAKVYRASGGRKRERRSHPSPSKCRRCPSLRGALSRGRKCTRPQVRKVPIKFNLAGKGKYQFNTKAPRFGTGSQTSSLNRLQRVILGSEEVWGTVQRAEKRRRCFGFALRTIRVRSCHG